MVVESLSDNNVTETLFDDQYFSDRELSIRYNNLKSFLCKQDEQQDVRRATAGSIAGKAFAIKPSAQSVTVRTMVFMPVSMAEYREGKRGKWIEIYSATLKRDLQNPK